MFCSNCGKEIPNSDFFCKYCGKELEPIDLDAYTQKIRELRRPTDFQVAKIINMIHKRELYSQQYANLEEYGNKELGLKKATMYMYSRVYDKFFDHKGNPRIENIEEWSIANLQELIPLSIQEIIFLQNNGFLNPQLKQSEIRQLVRGIKELKEEEKGN